MYVTRLCTTQIMVGSGRDMLAVESGQLGRCRLGICHVCDSPLHFSDCGRQSGGFWFDSRQVCD